MSAQGSVPAAPHAPARLTGTPGAARRRVAVALAGLALAAGACGAMPDPVLLRQMAPDGRAAAEVRLTPCDTGWCQTLWLGAPDALELLAMLTAERVEEIAWTPDGSRAGLLIDGTQLRLYDARSRSPAGQIDLVPPGATPPRIARGVTFSENAAAVTFDDCPRDHSGCRPGIVALR